MKALRSKPFSFFLVLSCIQLFLSISTAAPIFSNCSGDGYYQNSTFATNLNQLLSSLSAKAPLQGFYNNTVGDKPNRVYGLFQCRGDISPQDCQSCLKTSSSEIKQICLNSTQGVVWYDFCLLRYSDQYFFGSIESKGFNFYNDKFANNPYGKKDIPVEFVSSLVKQVPSRPSMFATAASPAQSIYSLVQCTMDLSKDSCNKCLEDVISAIKRCCSGKKGWQYSAPSCSMRYETYLFFNGSNVREELQRSYCPYDGKTASLLFNTNLNRLLLTLTSYAPTSGSGFYESYFGDEPHIVYGLVLCRGNIEPNVCENCLKIAWNDLIEACPNKTQAILWYNDCQLHYSNQSFSGIEDTEGFNVANSVNDSIGDLSLEVIKRLVRKTSEENLLFAVDQLRINGSETRYFYADCTRDLNSSVCHDCLNKMILQVMRCCIMKKGWRYFTASCSMRYEAYAFNPAHVLAPAPQPAPPLPQYTPKIQPTPNEVAGSESNKGKKGKTPWVLIMTILGVVLLGCCVLFLMCRRKKLQNERRQQSEDVLLDDLGLPTDTHNFNTSMYGGSEVETQELPWIDLGTLQHATRNFSIENKLGEGGFGAVYKGILPDGKEIAVKRLSKGSNQGLTEFKNEVILIAKLQHKNLVRLLFCCMEKEEKLLIYEYMSNTSLDAFLFDPIKRAELHWRIRFNIVNGIARGLLYLHKDSRLKIIHRDLKASNILLDHGMNPKISDFGLARTFIENQDETNTNKVIGTYGYMAPEYAMDGLFSVKSDVFSFGVLLLEIISGKKNSRSYLLENAQSLLAFAWRLWCDERETELIDPMLIESSPMEMVLRLVHIGLLCIQENATDRPTMSSVVLMLGSESIILPQPTEPPLYIGRRVIASDRASSSNEVTISEIEPR